MAPTSPTVRRVPALLTALAGVVVLVALLGVTGVVDRPTAATAAARSAATTGADVPAARYADGEDQVAADGAVVSSSPRSTPGTDGLSVATVDLLSRLLQPAADSASPPPAEATIEPVPPSPAVDPLTLPADSGAGRRVVYATGAQRVWLVEADGAVTRTYAVSGRVDVPSPGTYQVYSKSPTALSSDDTESMRHMVRFVPGEDTAIAFHDIPVLADSGVPVQSDDQLGQPLSAGSVRQSAADAAVLWEWVEIGMPVVAVD